jgi:hypothetical protein
LSREACAANLVIIGRERLSADPFRSLDPGALLLPVGRPVLLVPTGLNHLHANRIAVAWKDTREARRALSDSLPFLHDTEKVFLVEVCTEHEAKAVQHRMSNIMNYLARHRITTATALMLQAANVTDELLGVVRKENVDLLVAGAYGHSRLGECVFGGSHMISCTRARSAASSRTGNSHINDAFKHARRRLQDHVRRMQGHVEVHEHRQNDPNRP